MNYEITSEVLGIAAAMIAKARLDETPEQYVTKRIDALLQAWADEIESDKARELSGLLKKHPAGAEAAFTIAKAALEKL